jgi:predicted RNase H-like nuclease (RuvC/YqgF family)
MNTLYEIKQEYRVLDAELEILEGELTPELEKALEINEAEKKAKSDGYAIIIKRNEAEITMRKEEIKRQTAIVKRLENKNKWLKSALLDAINLFGDWSTDLFKFGTRKSTAVRITDEAKLADDYYKFTPTVNKTAIKEALKNGATVEGAELVENFSLSIK